MVKNREMYSLVNNEPGVNVEQVKINELYSFEGHPFKVKRDQELFELRRSIEIEGVLVPLLVRNSPWLKEYAWNQSRCQHLRTKNHYKK